MPGTTTTEGLAQQTAARSHLPALLGIALVARVVTLLTYAHFHPIQALPSFGYEDINIALSLHAGHGFSSPFHFPSGPTAFMTPGYPLFIAAAMSLFGDGPRATWILIFFQIFLSLVNLWLVVRVARSCFGTRTANLAGFLFAICEPMLFAPLYIWDTCFSALVLTAAVAVAPSLGRNKLRNIAAGVGAAIAILTNPALSLALLGIFAWSVWRARFIPRLGVIVFLAVFSLWPIRNLLVMHSFIPLRTNFGYELWLGNRPGADGNSPSGMGPKDNLTERRLFLEVGEVEYGRYKGSLARSYISAHPVEFARITGKRFLRFWAGTAEGPAAASHRTLYLSVLAFAGLALLWRQRRTFVLFAIPLFLFPLPYYITHAEVRYQFVIDPLLAILAGYALESLLAFISGQKLPSSEASQQPAAHHASA